MSKTAKRPVQLFAALALVLGTLVLTGGVAFADGSVDWTGKGTMDGELNTTQCDANNTQYLLWVFTPGGNNTVTAATLHLGGSGSGEFPMNTDQGQWKATTAFFDLATLTANVTFTGELGSHANLVISHGCPGEHAAISSISTEIHAGANDDNGTTVINNGDSIDLGSTVHDSAELTTDPSPLELPDGSFVIFYFFDDLTCSNQIDTSAPDYSVDGESSTVTEDAPNTLVEGPLEAGDYSYQAQFISGNTDVVTHATSDCEPFTVDKGDTTSETTIVRDDTKASLPINPVPHLPLGTSVHDTAVVKGQVDPFVISGQVKYHFYVGTTECDTAEFANQTVDIDASGLVPVVPDSASTGALGAGDYSFNAEYLGDDNYNFSALSVCEPFVIDKGVTTTVTQVLDKDGNDVTGTTVPNGSVVHDSADVGPAVAGFPITGTVDYYFSTNGCAGPFTLFDGAVPVGTDSKDTAALTPGSYAFKAVYSGDPNYAGSTGVCEPFNVRTFGYTMGFWGNTNGQALLAGTDAFTNPVALGISGGCYVLVDSAAKSLQIFPSTLNGIGLTGCGGTNGLDTGINTSSFNVLLAQNLALSYNIRYKSGYAGQTISGLGCTAVTGLTGASTVEQTRNYANTVIGNAKRSYGTTISQGTVGGLNTLLGCLNREF